MIQFYDYATDKPITAPDDFPLRWTLKKQLPLQGGRRQDIWTQGARKIFCIVPEGQLLYTVTAFVPSGYETTYWFYSPTEAHQHYIDWIDAYPEIDYEEGTL